MTNLERTGAELSQQRYLLECARQEEKDREERAQLARRTALTDAIEAGYLRGAAEMRERAARVCDLEDCVRIKASALATDIRALPLTLED